jgi:hypothetical protein
MNPKKLSLMLVVLSLMLSSLACGLFSAPGANPTVEAENPDVESTRESQPEKEETPMGASQPEQPSSLLPDLTGMIPAIDTNGDGVIGICEAVPTEVWEMVMARSMAGEPAPFQDPSLGDGCAFDFGSDNGAAYFSYVTFASEEQFNEALAYAVKAEPVTTLGDSAFLNYGPDARQLWVRAGDKAVMIAIGDQENVEGMLVVAPFLLLALPK